MQNHCLTSSTLPNQQTLVILGMFDGVHLGHQGVVEQGVSLAKELNLVPWVFSFASHPKERLQLPNSQVSAWEGNQLTALNERLHLLSKLGVEGAYCPEFSAELRSLTPEAFCKNLLQEKLHAQVLVVGYDFRFGKDREGSADWLVANQHRLGFQQIVVVAPVEFEGQPVSSTRIRQALKEDGNITLANQLLSRPYCVKASVVEGHRRGGSQLGFPTANLQWLVPSHQQTLVPAVGVYSASIQLGTDWLPATVNIGLSPTFADAEPRLQVEAHLPTYQGEAFYNQIVNIAFLKRLRNELKFDNLAALKSQISQDVEQTLAYFSQHAEAIETQLTLLNFTQDA
ncbi:MAG: riboflavin biosynthesis protein RibF [Vampirovibrio sp.]|nr:riboflavin biosynthesis protein RibF [Vampirovibrio sp.]